MNLHLFGVIALGILVSGAVGAGATGQAELSLVLAGAAAGCLVPQLFANRQK